MKTALHSCITESRYQRRTAINTSYVHEFVSNLEPVGLQTFANLAIVPLRGQASYGPAYLTLAEAMAAQTLTITELSTGGSVPELRVRNHAALPVLLLDGEERAGAKQNRALNTTILLPRSARR